MAYPVPETLVRTSHSIKIIATGPTGGPIGLINGWNPAMTKTITPIYQLGTSVLGVNTGEPFENVPGNVGGLQIAVQRYDLCEGGW